MARSSQVPRKSALINHGNASTSKICSAPNHNNYSSFGFFPGKYGIKKNSNFLWLRAQIEGWRATNSISIQLIPRLKQIIIGEKRRFSTTFSFNFFMNSMWYAQTLSVWNLRIAIMEFCTLMLRVFHNCRISGGQHGVFNFEEGSETFSFLLSIYGEGHPFLLSPNNFV